MSMHTQYATLTLRQLIALYRRVEWGCEKACGCGHCGLDMLAEYRIDDAGAVEIPEGIEI